MSRYFEFKDEKSNKFWSVSSSGKKMSVHYGKIGATGQKLDKEFESSEEAVNESEKAISKKLKEGYIEGNLNSSISPQLVIHVHDMPKSPNNPNLTIASSIDTQQMSKEELFAEVLAKHKGNKDIKQEIKWCKYDESNAKHLAELLIDNGDLELARKSYDVAIDDFSDDLDELTSTALSISKQSELNGKEWARLLFENILKKSPTPQNLVNIAQSVISGFDDKEWGRELYEDAFKKADNYSDFKTIAVSVFNESYLGDEKFATQAYQKAIDAAEDVYELVDVAEQIADSNDFSCDKEWAAKILIDARNKFTDDLDYLKSSLEALGWVVDSNIDDVSVCNLVENDKFDLAKILIEDGKDINSMGGYMKNIPLISIVAQKGRVDLLKLLISKGAEINPFPRDPLWFAAAAGQLEAVKFLLENGAKAHESLINAAASNGSIEVIEFLMNKGFDMNYQKNITIEGLSSIDTVSNTALMDVQIGNFDDDDEKQRKIGTVKFLLENGADVNAKGRFGNSALHFSANDNNVEIISLLLEAGANKKIKNDDGETAFKYADKNYIVARALLK